MLMPPPTSRCHILFSVVPGKWKVARIICCYQRSAQTQQKGEEQRPLGAAISVLRRPISEFDEIPRFLFGATKLNLRSDASMISLCGTPVFVSFPPPAHRVALRSLLDSAISSLQPVSCLLIVPPVVLHCPCGPCQPIGPSFAANSWALGDFEQWHPL